jgi:hypothetical protein
MGREEGKRRKEGKAGRMKEMTWPSNKISGIATATDVYGGHTV